MKKKKKKKTCFSPRICIPDYVVEYFDKGWGFRAVEICSLLSDVHVSSEHFCP